MTYNHAGFIRQALDSALSQEGVEYELLISEDCSTDGTREIVREYGRRFPERVRLLLSEQNIRSNQVVVRGIEAARGEFIALLDGDDYWLTPHKLRKQVAFLDQHPECTVCFHNVKAVSDNPNVPERIWTPERHPEISAFQHIWLGNFIATCSTMFRRGVIGKVPAWYDSFFPITDWPLHILNAEKGHIGFINEVLGVYRLHQGGYYSPLSERQKLREMLKLYQRLNQCLDFRHDRLAKTGISKYFIEWAEEYLQRGDIEAGRECFGYYLKGRPVNRYVSLRRMLKTAFRLYVRPMRRALQPTQRAAAKSATESDQ